MEYQNLRYEIDGVCAILTIAREKALNALNRATLDELVAAFEAAGDDPRVRGVIVTGAGDKAFVAGADITEMVELDTVEAARLAAAGHSVGDAIERLPKPVIAAVNGFALGGGCELALACDFIYASTRAKFGQPEVSLGLMCGFGGTQRLPRRVGFGRAMELILTGDTIDAAEALRIGLVNQVVAPEELLPRARACAEKIAKKGPLAVAASRRAVHASERLGLDEGNQLERQMFAALFASDDHLEGIKAFLAKRAPDFQGQ
jgi:enoyl-CoA hydratase